MYHNGYLYFEISFGPGMGSGPKERCFMKGWFGDFLLTAFAVLVALILYHISAPIVSGWFRPKQPGK